MSPLDMNSSSGGWNCGSFRRANFNRFMCDELIPAHVAVLTYHAPHPCPRKQPTAYTPDFCIMPPFLQGRFANLLAGMLGPRATACLDRFCFGHLEAPCHSSLRSTSLNPKLPQTNMIRPGVRSSACIGVTLNILSVSFAAALGDLGG